VNKNGPVLGLEKSKLRAHDKRAKTPEARKLNPNALEMKIEKNSIINLNI
jgi:hypothetical protein